MTATEFTISQKWIEFPIFRMMKTNEEFFESLREIYGWIRPPKVLIFDPLIVEPQPQQI